MKKAISGIIVFFLAISMFIFAAGCVNNKNSGFGQKSDEKINVYASVYPMYDFAKKIGGDKINLNLLVPSNIEPHDWEPSPRDMVNLQNADILIYNGAGLETWIDKVINSLNNKNLKLVHASEGINLLGSSDSDPHVWLNPQNAKHEMLLIKNALVAADAKNKEFYEKNYNENALKIDQLDNEFKKAAENFSKKDIVVTHEAFGYLCSAYGLNQIGIMGLNAEAEPTPSDIARIENYVKERNVKYIFYEKLISPRVAEVIANETGAGTAVLNPIEGLDQEDVKNGKEYFSIMRDNLSALSKALR